VTSFATLRALSFTNSAVFTALLVVAFGLDKPEPATTILGYTHGSMWILLSVLSLIAVRRRTIPFWLAVLVSVLGGIGPFVGSAGFVVARRRDARAAA
jgi:uncharacterized membrane protein